MCQIRQSVKEAIRKMKYSDFVLPAEHKILSGINEKAVEPIFSKQVGSNEVNTPKSMNIENCVEIKKVEPLSEKTEEKEECMKSIIETNIKPSICEESIKGLPEPESVKEEPPRMPNTKAVKKVTIDEYKRRQAANREQEALNLAGEVGIERTAHALVSDPRLH